MALTIDDIKVGHVYSAKKCRPVTLLSRLLNDRQVVWMSANRGRVQFDGPEVKIGQHRPIVDMEKFLRWADADITDQMPDNGEWRTEIDAT